MTVMGWLGTYMQVNATSRPMEIMHPHSTSCRMKQQHTAALKRQPDEAFVFPQFSGMEFAQTAQLIDLCSLDVGLANFPYSVIAAAAVSHTFDRYGFHCRSFRVKV